MSQVNAADLNLLKVFDAIYCCRHLTRAGERICMSQPAMSHALRRLRDLFQDPLFIRTSDGMVPTARAEEVAPLVGEALDRVQSALAAPHAFDPGTAEHVFTVGVNDYGSFLVIPGLMSHLRKQAPGIRVRTIQIGTTQLEHRGYHQTSYEHLDAGSIDISIMHRRNHPSRFDEEPLFAEASVCIVARENSAVGEKMDLETFLRLGHVKVYFESDEDPTWIDLELESRNLTRRVVVTLPHFPAAFATVAGSDLVATIPLRMATAFAPTDRLRFLEPPIPPLENQIVQVWHRRNTGSPTHRWLRGMVKEVCKEL